MKAIAAHDPAEAGRQGAIEARSHHAADEMDHYARSLDDQLDAIKTDPVQRYLPLGLAGLAALALGGVALFTRQRMATLQRRRREAVDALRKSETAAADMDGQDVVLTSETGALKLPGRKLRLGLIVGRSTERADVILARETVGREHARFILRKGRLFVTDLGSTNGTFVNNTRLIAQAETELFNNDMLSFGSQHKFNVRF